jgi:hypothetical protein
VMAGMRAIRRSETVPEKEKSARGIGVRDE